MGSTDHLHQSCCRALPRTFLHPPFVILVKNVLLSHLDCCILYQWAGKLLTLYFVTFLLGVLCLVLLSCIMYLCPSKLYPFYCPFCGPVISSPLNLTSVSRLTDFMSVMCYFILNLKLPGPCTTTQTQFSVEILENLNLSPSQHYGCADVTSPRDLNKSGKQNIYKRVNLCRF